MERVFSVLTAAYPKHPFARETMQIYERLLCDLPVDLLYAAVLQHVGESNYFPTIAEIRRRAAELTLGLPSAEQGWSEWRSYMSGYGERSSWHDLTKWTVEAMGGAPVLMQSDNPSTDRAHFLRIFEQFREERLRPTVEPPEVRGLREKARRESLEKAAQKALTE